MPVTHLVLENLLLLRLEGLADAQPAATDGASNVADATLVLELAGNILVRVALLLEIDDTCIVSVVVGLDRLRSSGLASCDTNVAVVGELVAQVRFVLSRASG